MNPEIRTRPHSKEQVWNLAGLNDEQLDEISMFIGGSAQKEIDSSQEPQAEKYDTVILEWGDERLEEILEFLTDRAHYQYGAELSSLVVLAEGHAIWMGIVPKTPVEREYVVDEKGEIDPFLLAMSNPRLDPHSIFYEWNQEGKKQLMNNFYAQPGTHRPWIEAKNYLLQFRISTYYRKNQ